MVWAPSVLSSWLDSDSLLIHSAIFPWTSCSWEMAWMVLPPPTSASSRYVSPIHWNVCCVEWLFWYWHRCNGQAPQHQDSEYRVNIPIDWSPINQSIRPTRCNPNKRFLEGANVSSRWLKPWKTQQYGRHCQVQVANAIPKHPSELLQLLRWNSFMFRHWLALPNISNVIYIPQKGSQTLQVKPNHKPSQSLHLRKMFIFSSCRLRGAQQQIWPAAAHHANAVSTTGRLAAKTLNIALSYLFNAFLIRKETNTGTHGRPRFGGDSHSSFKKDLAHTALAAAAIFLLADSIRAHSWIKLFVYCFSKEAGA